jgi:hypothetical protein
VEAWDATKALQLAPSGLDMVSLLWEILLHRKVNCWNLGEYITVLALSCYA